MHSPVVVVVVVCVAADYCFGIHSRSVRKFARDCIQGAQFLTVPLTPVCSPLRLVGQHHDHLALLESAHVSLHVLDLVYKVHAAAADVETCTCSPMTYFRTSV